MNLSNRRILSVFHDRRRAKPAVRRPDAEIVSGELRVADSASVSVSVERVAGLARAPGLGVSRVADGRNKPALRASVGVAPSPA